MDYTPNLTLHSSLSGFQSLAHCLSASFTSNSIPPPTQEEESEWEGIGFRWGHLLFTREAQGGSGWVTFHRTEAATTPRFTQLLHKLSTTSHLEQLTVSASWKIGEQGEPEEDVPSSTTVCFFFSLFHFGPFCSHINPRWFEIRSLTAQWNCARPQVSWSTAWRSLRKMIPVAFCR